jgi:hypothetical protein
MVLINVLFNIYLLLIFLLPYTGIAYPAYPMLLLVLLLLINKFRTNVGEIIVLFLVLIVISQKLFVGSVPHTLLSVKYFYGFSIFYFLFRQNTQILKVNFNILLISISFVLILEAILINTILPINLWPHFPAEHSINIIYQRPYGIGTNASITSTLLICLMLIRNQVQMEGNRFSRFASMMAIIAVIISTSGTGYGLLVLYFLLKSSRIFRTMIISAILLSSSYLFIFYYLDNYWLVRRLHKISPLYIEQIFQLKMRTIIETYFSSDTTLHELMYGRSWLAHETVFLGGDFGLLNLFVSGGILTILVYSIIISYKINKYNAAPILIFVFGAIHYAAIFSTPGQILFAFCLALNENKVKSYLSLKPFPKYFSHLKNVNTT